jgi:sulfite reductase (NADPH) hemoprotein beta-component
LYRRLSAAGLGQEGAGTALDVTSCPGAEACRLAVTQSRGLGQLLQERLEAHPELVAAAGDLKLKVSGCPNGCGLHHVAGIGFQGSVRKLDGKAVPQYFVTVGGGVENGAARFGRLAAKLPARRAPEAVERLLQLYRRDGRQGETATAFFGRVEIERLRELLSDLQTLTTEDATPTDFVDLAEQSPFVPETLPGECSA